MLLDWSRRIDGSFRFLRALLLSIGGLLLISNFSYMGIESYLRNWMNCIYIISTSLIIIFISLENWLLVIISCAIAYFNYSICIGNYLFPEIAGFFSSLSNDPVSQTGITVLVFYTWFLLLLWPTPFRTSLQEKNYFVSEEESNIVFIIGLDILLILIFIFGYIEPAVPGTRGTTTTYYEYSLILFILGFYFSGKNMYQRLALLVLLVMFIVQDFIYAGRATGLQLAICGFIMLYSNRVKIWVLLPAALVFLIVLTGIGIFRADMRLSLESITEIISSLFRGRFALDTAFSAYHSSLTVIKMELKYSLQQRIGQFSRFLCSQLLGSKYAHYVPLSILSINTYLNYGGTILPVYFYYYLSWLGVALSASIVGFYARIISKGFIYKSGLIKCVAVYITCSVIRWYLYSPFSLIRGALICAFAYMILESFFTLYRIAVRKSLPNEMWKEKQMKVLWLTNIPSPYRVDFFNQLGTKCNLTVLFEKHRSSERDKGWQGNGFAQFTGLILPGISFDVDKAFCPSVIGYILKKYDYIVITNYSTPTGILAVIFMKIIGIPYIIEGDGAFPKLSKGLKSMIKRAIIKNAEACFSTARIHDEYYLQNGAKINHIFRYPFTSIKEENILIKPLDASEKRELRMRLKNNQAFTLLAVGQFIYRKGFDLLLEACARIERDMAVYIVGGNPTQDYLDLIDRHHLKNVHFIEFKDKAALTDLYRSADVFVLPTREDIWGLVVNEAMANGLPVITTNKCIAGTELIGDRDTGIVVDSEDVTALAESISTLYKDVELREKMAQNALVKIREYTIEKMVENHVNFFKYNKDKGLE